VKTKMIQSFIIV